jgi:hypothetical protein
VGDVAALSACYERRVTEEGKSGKRVVVVMLTLAIGLALIAWFAASRIEKDTTARHRAAGEPQMAAVLSEGVLYEATPGDPGLVTAKDVGSGKELWRAELGTVATQPALVVKSELIEVEIAGTAWMTLDRTSGKPVE